MTLGQKIKKLRTDKGLTQKDLADQLHVTFQTVSKWESDTNEPDIATLKELSKFFNCSLDYLLSDSDEEKKEEPIPEPVVAPVEQVTKTIIIHQKELHVCRRCGKDIPEDELAVEHLTKSERHGKTHHTVPAGDAYYHKECLEIIQKEREAETARIKTANAKRSKRLSFGWGIAGGVTAFVISLVVMLIAGKNAIHPVVAVLLNLLIGYLIFSMIYCIITGSYISDVFLNCASVSIRFPGLIFSWDIEGFIWAISMKILFATLGFLFGLFTLAFAIVASAALGGVSFPFVLIHNIHTNYVDAF